MQAITELVNKIKNKNRKNNQNKTTSIDTKTMSATIEDAFPTLPAVPQTAAPVEEPTKLFPDLPLLSMPETQAAQAEDFDLTEFVGNEVSEDPVNMHGKTAAASVPPPLRPSKACVRQALADCRRVFNKSNRGGQAKFTAKGKFTRQCMNCSNRKSPQWRSGPAEWGTMAFSA